MNKVFRYHNRVLIPLSIGIIAINLIYTFCGLPYPILFSFVLMIWWRTGLLRVFRGMPGAPSMALALRGLVMALFWPILPSQ